LELSQEEKASQKQAITNSKQLKLYTTLSLHNYMQQVGTLQAHHC
jgi:hypothetical protein